MKFEIAVIGLGYVGLPLAVEFAKKYKTIGFDIDQKRIKELDSDYDKTDEVLKDDLENSPLTFSLDATDLQDCNIYIVTVPTPVDKYNKPDLTALQSASEIVGKLLYHGDIVIYESTVYPGCTEEECVPVLENFSNTGTHSSSVHPGNTVDS